jgi:zinc transport system substrate-binding protein
MLKTVVTTSLLLTTTITAFAAPKVVVSIAPLHSLVAGVMDGVGEPELLLKGVNSEHQASYSPQQIADLSHADLVFIIGDNLEVKLGEISGTDTVNGKAFVRLNQAEGIVKHHIREGGTWEVDGDEPATGNTVDPHIWLDPENAKAMIKAITARLSEADAANATTYNANASNEIANLDALETEINASLQFEKGKPYIVFHDAFQYFESRFGMTAVGSISDYTATPPSAARLAEIRNKILSSNAVCAFREPQYSDAAVSIVTEGTLAKLGVLDPIGAKLTPGKFAYAQLLRDVTQNLKICLSN